MKRIHLIISGYVQGVGFRMWFKREAKKLRISGWVKNRADGAVEVVAEGTENALQNLIKQARQGPEVAHVTEVETKWGSATREFADFVAI